MCYLRNLAIAAFCTVGASSAFAADVAATATTQFQTDGVDTMTGIGTALLAVAGVAVVFKWAKGALFS